MAEENTNAILQELVKRTNDNIRRLHDLEGKVQSVEERTSSLENTNLAKLKGMNDRFSSVEIRMKSMETTMARLENNIEKISKQMNKTARKNDIKELEKMFELLSPIRNEFITRRT
jgi:predicted  nucleic acid-binding Zn-ribbon protein